MMGGNHPKHVEQFPNINKLCNFASCWIYMGILLGDHPILHISRIRVNFTISRSTKTSLSLRDLAGYFGLRPKPLENLI
jgi:hypothetical protein